MLSFLRSNFNGFIHILAVYSVIHILYSDLGLEFEERYARIIKHPVLVFLLIASIAYAEMDGDVYRTALVVGIFYGSRFVIRNIKPEVFDAVFPPPAEEGYCTRWQK